jgi:hypothetical protein
MHNWESFLGMNKGTKKGQLILGIVLAILFGMITLPLFDEYSSSGKDNPAALLFIISLNLFVMLPGIILIIDALAPGAKRKKFLTKGVLYYGKIVSFQQNYNPEKKHPLWCLEVRYFDRFGRISNASVLPYSGSKSGYNLGETVQISEYNGEFMLISTSSQAIRLPGEERLFMTYHEGAQSINQLRPESYTCPHCGAGLMIVKGHTVKCPYCDSYVTNTRVV